MLLPCLLTLDRWIQNLCLWKFLLSRICLPLSLKRILANHLRIFFPQRLGEFFYQMNHILYPNDKFFEPMFLLLRQVQPDDTCSEIRSITGAPFRRGTPRMIALEPSREIWAPILSHSGICMNLLG